MKKNFLLTTLSFFCTSLFAQFYSIESIKAQQEQQAKVFMSVNGIEESPDDKATLLEQDIILASKNNSSYSPACYKEKKAAFDTYQPLIYSNKVVDKINDITFFLKLKGYLNKVDSTGATTTDPAAVCREGIYNCLTSTIDFQYLAKKTHLDVYIIVFGGHKANLVKDPVSKRFYIVDYFYGSVNKVV